MTPPPDTLLTRLEAHAAERPDAPLLRGDWGALTAARLADGVARAEAWLLARGLGAASTPATHAGTHGARALEAASADRAGNPAAAGVSVAGPRLALCLEKGAAFVLLHLAALRRGLVVLPLNPRAPVAERDALLAEAGAAALVLDDTLPAGAARCAVHALPTDARFEELPPAPAAPPPPADAPAVMLATSGTTGRPKLAVHTHASLAANQRALQQAWEWSPRDALLHVLPHFHVHGLFVALHGALWAGAETHFARRFDTAEVWTELAAGRVSVFMSVPTMVHRLIADAPCEPNVGRLRLMTCGSAPLSLEQRAAFAALCDVSIVERYGMTETGILTSQALRADRRGGGVGAALPGVELRVADPSSHAALPAGEEGEVQTRGASVFAGYWRRPEAHTELFTPDGWLRTGDLGELDADGALRLHGRSKDLVISGGFNVHPREVELVLEQHAAVDQAAVVGLADPDFGERVVAAVVLADGHVPADAPTDALARALIAHCRERLAAYKCPKRVVFRDALPRNAMGKLQKAELARELGGS